MKKTAVIVLISLASLMAQSAEKMKMNFSKEELTKVIEAYSKAYGQKFIVDPGVRGTVTIMVPETVEQAEAFNHLSSALALNGYGISKQGDTMVVRSARNVQRDLIEVGVNRPELKPERMYTWIYNVKNVPALQINRDLRIFPSKDGEMSVNPATNQLIITDWVSNLNRIADILAEVDKKPTGEAAKFAEASKKMFPPTPTKNFKGPQIPPDTAIKE